MTLTGARAWSLRFNGVMRTPTPPDERGPTPLSRARIDLQVLTWDEPLSASDEAAVRRRVAGWVGEVGRLVSHRMPAWLWKTREQGERAFTRALLIWLAGRGIRRTDTLLVLEPPGDRPLGSATLHALLAITGRYPLAAVRWASLRGRHARERIPPVVKNLSMPGAVGLSGLADPDTQGLVALLTQAAIEADLPEADAVRHEQTLRAVVPAVRALRGRCLPADLIGAIDPAEGLIDLEWALPEEQPERQALAAWLHPWARGGVADHRLRRHLEADLHDLADLLRSTDLG
jgi:hypothetical protein